MAKPKGKKTPVPKLDRNPLSPTAPKKLRQLAIKTMNRVYKSAEHDLSSQEKRLAAVNEKRAIDNKYYLGWLQAQTNELEAHAAAADQSLQGAQQEIAQRNEDAYEAMRTRLVQEGAGHSGVVSNAQSANAFDVSDEQRRGLETVANERTRTAQQLHSQSGTRSLVKSSNFAMMAAAEANRVANMWQGFTEITEGRTKLRLDKAAKTAQEVARLLDKEIDKAQIRGELKSQAQQLGLDQAKFNEDVRHNKATEADSAADNAREDKKAKGGSKGDEVGQRQKRQESRKITSQINSSISFIAGNPDLQRQLQSNPAAVKRALLKQKVLPIYAQAAIELASHNTLTSSTRKLLKQQGYIIPPAWR